MKRSVKKEGYIFAILMMFMLVMGMFLWMGTDAACAEDGGEATIKIVANGLDKGQTGDENPITVDPSDAKAGDTVTIAAADNVKGYYLAQIRLKYQNTSDETVYKILEREGNSATFEMPQDAKEGTVEVDGDYISVVWDGTIDLTWYDPNATEYQIKYAAQWAGATVLRNGLFNDMPTREHTIQDNQETTTVQIPDIRDEQGEPVGLVSEESSTSNNQVSTLGGHVTAADGSGYQTFEDTNGDGRDTTIVGDLDLLTISNGITNSVGGNNLMTTNVFWFGPEAYTGKTITLMRDLDMGGILKEGARKTDPGQIDRNAKGEKLVNPNWTGPNYMPMGGNYAMDIANGYTIIGAGFNGTLNGAGHMVYNINMHRHVSTGEFGNSQATGFVGLLGSFRTEIDEQVKPVVENVAVDGFIYGNRMVGGIVGETYHSKGIEIRNCINFATVYNTDAKGCGGILGNGKYSVEYADLPIRVRNCANFGYVCTGYNKCAGGLIGSSEGYVYDSYTIGYVGHDGSGETGAANALGTNNGGAVWYNAYALRSSSWFEASGRTTIPGSQTPEVWNSTKGSAIMVKDSPDDLKKNEFLGMLNGKVKKGETDEYGYLKSDDSVLKNTKRNWVAGKESGEKVFVSGKIKETLAAIQTWHDPETNLNALGDKGVGGIAAALSTIDATGMPLPATFVKNAAKVKEIVSTGTPTKEYLEGETFDTGDHENQSDSPKADKECEYSLWAIYDDDTYEEIADYDIFYENGGESFSSKDSKVTIGANYGGKEFREEIPVNVAENRLQSIEVSGPPTLLLYGNGEVFNPDGMEITTKYGTEERLAMAIKTTWENGKPVVTRSTTTTNGKTFAANTFEAISEEAAAAFKYQFYPDQETKLDPEVTAIIVSHTFAEDTMETEVPITVLEGKAPMVKKDSNDNWSVDIASEDDLLWFANQVTSRTRTDMNANLLQDITITSKSFQPIGARTSTTYNGIFDGQGHAITMDVALETESAALFYSVGTTNDKTGKVVDLTIKGSIQGGSGNTTANDSDGAAAIALTVNGGIISGCTNEADIRANTKSDKARSHAAGIAVSVKNGGQILSCTNTGRIEGAGFAVGGIAATISGNSSLIEKCLNIGEIVSVAGTGSSAPKQKGTAGGVVGTWMGGNIEQSINRGPVSGKAGNAAGGIIGLIAANQNQSIINNYNTGNVTIIDSIENAAAGGIIGYWSQAGTNLSVANCYNAGLITTSGAGNSGAWIGNGTNMNKRQTVSKFSHNLALQGSANDLIGSSNAEIALTEDNVRFYDSAALKAAEEYLGSAYTMDVQGINKENYPILLWEADEDIIKAEATAKAAEEAKKEADDAKGEADKAAGEAKTAKEAADAAKEKADEEAAKDPGSDAAVKAAEAAKTAADDAKTKADAAKDAADTAKEKADAAEKAAGEAVEAAIATGDSDRIAAAEDAQGAAQTAAKEAETAAKDANDKANEASKAAEAAKKAVDSAKAANEAKKAAEGSKDNNSGSTGNTNNNNGNSAANSGNKANNSGSNGGSQANANKDSNANATNPANQKGADGTALGKGASSVAAEKAITGMKSDGDPAGARFAPLMLRSAKQTKTSEKVTWKKVSGTKKYVLYGNKCGKAFKMKKIATTNTNSINVKKIAGKKLKKKTYYKYVVVALDANDNVVSTSKVIHVATKGSKKAGNHKSVLVKKAKVTVKTGKTTKIKAKAVAAKKTKVKKHRALSYESANASIATVSKKGVIKGVKKGKTKIYAYAQNGIAKAITVTVK